MKKLLTIGILALSAASFANTNNTKGHNMANMAAGQHMMEGMMKNGKMGSMMSPEMMKMMEEKGMMKDGKCVMMGQMMKGQPAPNVDKTKKN